MISRAETSKKAKLGLLVLTATTLLATMGSAACEGETIDGGSSGATGRSSSSAPPPVDTPNSFYGKLTLKALTKTDRPEGDEISPSSAGVTFKVTFVENGTFALDDGKACIRGFYTTQKGARDLGALTFTPSIGRDGAHDFEFRERDLVVADLVPGYPWARLARTSESSRCGP